MDTSNGQLFSGDNLTEEDRVNLDSMKSNIIELNADQYQRMLKLPKEERIKHSHNLRKEYAEWLMNQ